MDHPAFPDLSPPPNTRSIRDGDWSAAETWSLNRLPKANEVVHIEHAVTISDRGNAAQISIRAGGSLTMRDGTNLRVSTLQVLPGGGLFGGTIEKGLQGKLIFKPGPLLDGTSLGCGLVVEGTCKLFGRLISDRRPRIARPPKVGDKFIALKDPPRGWQAGDRFLLPDTEWRAYMADQQVEPYAAKHQFRVVNEVTQEGLHFEEPLTHSNTYPDEADGSKKYMGRIANLTTSFDIVSEAPDGVRGHTVYSGNADVTLDGIGFRDLGRTHGGPIDPVVNPIGRYPVHFHHCMGPIDDAARPSGHQFVMQNCVVERSRKWPVTIHDAMSSWGVVSDNVIWDAEFDGIATENGSEYQTRIERNFIGNIRNGSCIWHRSRLCPTNDNYCHGAMEDSRFNDQTNSRHEPGGIYYQGLGNRIQPGEPAVLSGEVMVPKFAGAHHDDDLISINIDNALIAECRGNEFVCCNLGVLLDHLKQSAWPHGGAQKQLVSDTVGWNGFGPPVSGYDTRGHHIDGMISKAHGNEILAGTSSTDIGTVWSKFNIHTTGVAMIINVPKGTIVVEDCVLVGDVPVLISRPWQDEASEFSGDPRGLHIIFRRCLMTALSGGLEIQIIDSPQGEPTRPFSVRVEDHQGIRGNTFTVEETFRALDAPSHPHIID
jgi:hypothetical protein